MVLAPMRSLLMPEAWLSIPEHQITLPSEPVSDKLLPIKTKDLTDVMRCWCCARPAPHAMTAPEGIEIGWCSSSTCHRIVVAAFEVFARGWTYHVATGRWERNDAADHEE
jgi:hypothetical protein